jgi:hypothetical protein
VQKGLKHEVKVIAMLDADPQLFTENARDCVQKTRLQVLYCPESRWYAFLPLDEWERKMKFELEMELQPWKRR